jgi:hypothetical protein
MHESKACPRSTAGVNSVERCLASSVAQAMEDKCEADRSEPCDPSSASLIGVRSQEIGIRPWTGGRTSWLLTPIFSEAALQAARS